MSEKTLRYRPPRLSTESPVPAIFMTRKHIKMYNEMVSDALDRADWGMMLFLLEVANIVRSKVQQLAPDLLVGKEKVSYADDLRIALLHVEKSNVAVAIYLDSRSFKVSEKDVDKLALFFQPKHGSPEWVDVLRHYGPWPSDMLPFYVPEGKARIISRRAREDEIGALKRRILKQRKAIQKALRATKAPSYEIQEDGYNATSGNAVGIVAREDMGYNVLRAEFGYDGESQNAHWRPALRALDDEIPGLMRKYIEYVETGRESSFNIPSEVLEMTSAEYRKGDAFARALAPYAPTGKVGG